MPRTDMMESDNVGTQVSLRPLSSADQAFLELLNKRPEVQGRLGGVGNPSDPNHGRISAILVAGTFAGVVGLVASQAFDGTDVELICALLERYEGKGVATAACRRVLEQHVASGNDQRVLACIAPDNSDALDLARRVGFVKIGSRYMSEIEIWKYDSDTSRSAA